MLLFLVVSYSALTFLPSLSMKAFAKISFILPYSELVPPFTLSAFISTLWFPSTFHSKLSFFALESSSMLSFCILLVFPLLHACIFPFPSVPVGLCWQKHSKLTYSEILTSLQPSTLHPLYFLCSPSLDRNLQTQVNITFWTALNLKYWSWNISSGRLCYTQDILYIYIILVFYITEVFILHMLKHCEEVLISFSTWVFFNTQY